MGLCTKRARNKVRDLRLHIKVNDCKRNVEKLTAEMEDTLVLPCDVTNQNEVDAAFEAVGEKYGKLDFLIHSIAFAPREALEGEFLTTTREAFRTAMEISAFSLTQLSLAATPLMTEGGSIVTMTYYGAEKVVQHYNVMGVAKSALESSTRYLAEDLGKQNIRVNAISAGPINTLSARGVKNMGAMLSHIAESAPLEETSKPAKSATPHFFSSAISLRQSPAKRSTLIADSISLEFNNFGF